MLSKIESRQQDRFGRIGSIVSIFSILLFFALGSDAFVPTKTIIPKRFFGRNGILIQRRSTVGLDVLENVDAMVLEEQEDLELATLDTMEIKRLLLELLPRMTGTPQDLVSVESYVNTLEDRYTPVQTLDFLNLAMAGEWQLLFSTNLSGGPKPHFRLREMFQRVEATSLEGAIANQATWDLAEDGSTFDATGTFTVKCSYKINQGARMVMDLDDHIIELARGSVVPKDVQGLVGLLQRAMPKELFDPTEHAMDTTYLDGDLRIVRMTGPRLEGVRDIFIRRGSMEINPVKDC